MRAKKKEIIIKHIKCNKCGNMNVDIYKFCIYCGTKLGG